MSTLCDSIKFRSLLDQLSKQEFLQFMNKIFDDNKTNLIATSLFNHFVESTNNNDNELNNINSILSNIIQSRKIKSKPLPTTNIKLHQLPSQLIGHTASFLDQSSYFRLQKVNRSVFMASNAPNKLVKLNVLKIKDYRSINLPQFRSLKQLQINVHKFNQFILPNNGQFIMNQLDELLLNARNANNCDIDSFITANCINFENITKLRFDRFGNLGRDNYFNIDTFWRILSTFPNIEFLELTNVLTPSFDGEKLKEMIRNLKGLTVRAGRTINNNILIQHFGNDLQFLFLLHPPSNGYDFSNIDFSKLQELVSHSPSNKTISEILKSAKNLRKFRIQTKDYYQVSLSHQELKTVISEVMVKCKSLQYIEITANDDRNCIAILDGIESALFATKKWKRKELKIKLGILRNGKINANELILNISRIIRWLTPSNIDQFMFIWDMNNINKNIKDKMDAVQILNDLNDISENVDVTVNDFCFVLTNKNCAINGWHENWLFDLF